MGSQFQTGPTCQASTQRSMGGKCPGMPRSSLRLGHDAVLSDYLSQGSEGTSACPPHNSVKLVPKRREIQMKNLMFVSLLLAVAFTLRPSVSYAQTCRQGYYNMLHWMNLHTGATQHLTGTSNPQYTVLPANNVFWYIKGGASRSRPLRVLLVGPLPASFRESLTLGFEALNAGTKPNPIPVPSATRKQKNSTTPLIPPPSMFGVPGGDTFSNVCEPQ
jgi:hypothetical protein